MWAAILPIDTQAAERLQMAAFIKVSDDIAEQAVEVVGWGAVKHLSDVIVAGDLGHAEQSGGVRRPAHRLQRSLMPQEGRTLHQKDRKCRKTDVRHVVLRILPDALIGKLGRTLTQSCDVSIEFIHPLNIYSQRTEITTMC